MVAKHGHLSSLLQDFEVLLARLVYILMTLTLGPVKHVACTFPIMYCACWRFGLVPAHLQGLSVNVHRDYDMFIKELTARFPHEEAGIKAFYGECWKVRQGLHVDIR
jgi:hypothetical protein